jgi:8-oxo-dGTP diphosphatase
MITVIVKGMIVKDKKILVIQRSHDEKVVPDAWEMVGGKIQMEESLEEGLLREIKEETNLDCTIEKILYATDHNTNNMGKVVLLVYLCRALSKEVEISEEHQAYKWVDVEEFRKIVFEQIVQDLDRYGALDIAELK